MYRQTLIVFLLSSLFSATSSFAAEKEKWYQVELVIFKRTASQSADEESWIYTDLPATREEGKRLVPATTIPTASGKKSWIPFHQTAQQALSLTDVKEKLDTSTQFEVLVHTGWRQPLTSGGAVTPVYLNSTEIMAEATASDTPEAAATPEDAVAVVENAAVTAPTQPESAVVGNVTLKLSRYLHFAYDVYYKPSPDSKYIAWDDSRRIKLNEVNYFDHPLLGIITRVTPIADGR